VVAFYEELDSAGRSSAMEVFNLFKTIGQKAVNTFKTEVAAWQVVELRRANHYVFISNPKEVTDGIRKFLKEK
jgi:hypothetical protein